jgi:hypothetical protein
MVTPVYLRVGPAETDTIYVYHQDGGDTEKFTESVPEMLAALRFVNRGL